MNLLITSFSVKSISPLNNGFVSFKSKSVQGSGDTFVRLVSSQELAKNFREQVVLPFSDWESYFPCDGEDGSDLLKSKLKPYTKSIESFSQKEAETFTRLVFGEKQIKQLEQCSVKNSSLREFKEALEKSLGNNLSSIFK